MGGCKADLEYEAGNRKYSGVMKGDKVTIDKRSYEIVFISEDEVVLSDRRLNPYERFEEHPVEPFKLNPSNFCLVGVGPVSNVLKTVLSLVLGLRYYPYL